MLRKLGFLACGLGLCMSVAFTSRSAGAATPTFPTAAITSPASGAILSGIVTVTADGKTDPSQSDLPYSVDFYVDNNQVGDQVTFCESGPNPNDCPVSYSWDTTGLSGQHTLQVKLYTDDGKTALSPVVTVTISNKASTVAITSPASGAILSGIVTVTADGKTDPSQSDLPYSVDFYVDNNQVGDQVTFCESGPNPNDCPVSYSWDTTGLSGQHTLQVKLYTDDGKTALSPVVTVTISNKASTVAITSPASGAILSGIVTVTADGKTDPSQSDLPYSVDFYVDNNQVGDQVTFCESGPNPNDCPVSYSWDTTGLSGQHTLQVKLYTDDGKTALSRSIDVRVYTRTHVALGGLAETTTGHNLTVHGSVRANANNSGAAGMVVTVTARPPVGAASSRRATTAANGSFSVTFKVKVNTTFSVRAAAAAGYGASTAASNATVRASVKCSMSNLRPRVGQTDSGHCTIAQLPSRVTADVQEYYGGSWHTFEKVKSVTGKIKFALVGIRSGTSPTRVQISRNKVYATSFSNTMKLMFR